jgi:hypothetical protein
VGQVIGVRDGVLAPLHPDMSAEAQSAIIDRVNALWYRASPNGCVEVCPLRGGDAGIGPLTDAVMGSADEAGVLSDVQWRTVLGADCVQGVLTRFRGLAAPLGHQRGKERESCLLVLDSVTSTPQWIRQPETAWYVLLEGVDDPFHLGQAALFVNRPTRWSADPDGEDDDTDASDFDAPDLVPTIPGGIRIHTDETLVPDANRLMELWKGAVKTITDKSGITSLGFYDVFHDEIVILQAAHGMRIRGDMRLSRYPPFRSWRSCGRGGLFKVVSSVGRSFGDSS